VTPHHELPLLLLTELLEYIHEPRLLEGRNEDDLGAAPHHDVQIEPGLIVIRSDGRDILFIGPVVIFQIGSDIIVLDSHLNHLFS